MFGKISLDLLAAKSLGNKNNLKSDEELGEELKEEFQAQQLSVVKVEESQATGLLYWYFCAGNFANELTKGKYEQLFGFFMILIIILAAANAGLETNPAYPVTDGSITDLVVLAAFCVEFAVKVVAEKAKPHRYFTGSDGLWNTFDFLVLIFCLLGSVQNTFSFGKSSIARLLTRLLRITRVVKLLKRIPSLHVIIKGLIGGLESIGYILLLLILFVYIFAVVGVIYFGEHDPFNFRDVPVAMMTLFRALTYDNWGINVGISMHGCAEFTGGVYPSLPANAEADAFWPGVPEMYRCDRPKGMPSFALAYWVSFVVITGLILLSLFIGTITISMQASLEEVRRDNEEMARKKRLMQKIEELKNFKVLRIQSVWESLQKTAQTEEEMNIRNLSRMLSVAFLRRSGDIFSSCFNLKSAGSRVLSLNEEQKLAKIDQMRREMRKAWNGHAGDDLDEVEEYSHRHTSSYKRAQRYLATRFRSIVDSAAFEYFSIIFLIFTAALVGFEINEAVTASPTEALIVGALEWLVFAVFLCEVILRFGADEFNPLEYFRNPWNIFDVVVTATSGGRVFHNAGPMLRIVRIFRVAKLAKVIPELGVIVNSIVIASGSILYIGIIMVVVYYIFGLLGLLIFGDNDGSNFSSLDLAIIHLFDWATLDNWGVVMYKNVYGCDNFPYGGSPNCISPKSSGVLAFVYFLLFVVIGSFVLLTLFIGVITTGMEAATNSYKKELDVENRLRKFCHEHNLSSRIIDHYRHVFAILDLDGSGSVEPTEISIGLRSIGIELTNDELMRWIAENDENFDGEFDLPEFIEFMFGLEKRGKGHAARLKLKKSVSTIIKRQSVRKIGIDNDGNSDEEISRVKSVDGVSPRNQLPNHDSSFGTKVVNTSGTNSLEARPMPVEPNRPSGSHLPHSDGTEDESKADADIFSGHSIYDRASVTSADADTSVTITSRGSLQSLVMLEKLCDGRDSSQLAVQSSSRKDSTPSFHTMMLSNESEVLPTNGDAKETSLYLDGSSTKLQQNEIFSPPTQQIAWSALIDSPDNSMKSHKVTEFDTGMDSKRDSITVPFTRSGQRQTTEVQQVTRMNDRANILTLTATPTPTPRGDAVSAWGAWMRDVAEDASETDDFSVMTQTTVHKYVQLPHPVSTVERDAYPLTDRQTRRRILHESLKLGTLHESYISPSYHNSLKTEKAGSHRPVPSLSQRHWVDPHTQLDFSRLTRGSQSTSASQVKKGGSDDSSGPAEQQAGQGQSETSEGAADAVDKGIDSSLADSSNIADVDCLGAQMASRIHSGVNLDPTSSVAHVEPSSQPDPSVAETEVRQHSNLTTGISGADTSRSAHSERGAHSERTAARDRPWMRSFAPRGLDGLDRDGKLTFYLPYLQRKPGEVGTVKEQQRQQQQRQTVGHGIIGSETAAGNFESAAAIPINDARANIETFLGGSGISEPSPQDYSLQGNQQQVSSFMGSMDAPSKLHSFLSDAEAGAQSGEILETSRRWKSVNEGGVGVKDDHCNERPEARSGKLRSRLQFGSSRLSAVEKEERTAGYRSRVRKYVAAETILPADNDSSITRKGMSSAMKLDNDNDDSDALSLFLSAEATESPPLPIWKQQHPLGSD